MMPTDLLKMVAIIFQAFASQGLIFQTFASLTLARRLLDGQG